MDEVNKVIGDCCSDIRGAGTDANISIMLFGQLPDGSQTSSGPFKLDSSADDFKRGATDTFVVASLPLGDVSRVQVTSDGAGLSSGWHLKQVPDVNSVTTQNPFSQIRMCDKLQFSLWNGNVIEAVIVHYW